MTSRPTRAAAPRDGGARDGGARDGGARSGAPRDHDYPVAEGTLVPGWPAGVHPPGSEGFEQTAITWLLDVVPPDYRLHGVLLRHPLALATLARHHVAACVAGARQGYRTARAELGEDLPPGGLTAVLAAYRSEGRRLVETAEAVELVIRALRGEDFIPQMGGPASPRSRPPSTDGADRGTDHR